MRLLIPLELQHGAKDRWYIHGSDFLGWISCRPWVSRHMGYPRFGRNFLFFNSEHCKMNPTYIPTFSLYSMPTMSPFVRHANDRSLLSKLKTCQGKNDRVIHSQASIPQNLGVCVPGNEATRPLQLHWVMVQWRIHSLGVGDV